MSMQYPVLNNKPIDQWKVTELREELKKRKITSKGLKEDLVKRLDEAIHNEKEPVNEGEMHNGSNPDSDIQDTGNEVEAESVAEDNPEAAGSKNEKIVDDVAMVDADGSAGVINQGVNVEDGDINHDTSLDGPVVVSSGNSASIENNETDNQSPTTQFDISGQDSRFDEKHEDSKPPVEDAMLGSDLNNIETDNQNTITQSDTSGQYTGFDENVKKHEHSNPPVEDATLSPDPNNQVPEVSLDLGFLVTCESISNDSVSINEKNKLKDNLNANNFHLELEVKPEMVQPSSGSVPPVVGEVHTLDDDKGPGKDQVSLEKIDANYANSVELSKKEDIVDGGSPEKLNLDKSSGDESMEEDVLENKLVESNSNSDELGERAEVSRMHDADEGKGILVDAMPGGFSPNKMDIVAEEEVRPTTTIEKRKVEVLEVKTSDSSKRQRRWNPETIKVPELQSPDIISSSIPKDAFQPIPRRTFARSDSTLSSDSPKERVVPPSQKPATNSLRIDRFLRPFTLKAVQELLAKTGTVCNFWIDHIKTHCYVTYSSVEEAVATRNTVYNLQWPPNGGRLLIADFVDPQEVKLRVEAPPQSPVPISPSPTTPKASPFQQPQVPKPTRQHDLRQQLPPPPPLPSPPPLSDIPNAKERLSLPLPLPPPPPPPQKKQEPAVVTLDDLFKKTKATPRIYYLPLSEEQVAAKLASQGKSAME